MNKFYTSDWHLGHGNIIKYSKRPFKDATRMIDVYIKQANQMVKPEDMVYMVGDFLCYGKDRGIAGMKIKPEEILNQLTGTWVFVEGNHDKNNKVKPHMQYAMTIIAKQPAIISHYPSTDYYDKQAHYHKYINKKDIKIWICGHVHNSWKCLWDKKNRILNVNIGVDVWNHTLVKENKLIQYIQTVKNNNLKDPFFEKK